MIIFLDLETTGLESVDKIVSIAVICVDDNGIFAKYEFINEGKKISSKASSINNITNEMLKGKGSFKESEIFEFLQKNNNKDTTIIAHNVKFDLKMLLQSGFVWQGKVVDTLRCTKHLIPECDMFSLQFLRYELKLYKKEKQEAEKYFPFINAECLSAHNAISDVIHVQMLYEYLLDLKSHQELVELSLKNVLIEKFEFGKYSGRYIEEISMCDRGYLEWVLDNIAGLDEDLIFSINRYLNKQEGEAQYESRS